MAQPLPPLERRPETAQDKLVKAYLREHSPTYRACDELSEQVSSTVHWNCYDSAMLPPKSPSLYCRPRLCPWWKPSRDASFQG